MSIFHNNGLIGASGQGGGAGGYSISRSLRFNSSDSAYLSRTPASAGNRKTWTWAGWVKRWDTGTGLQQIFSCCDSNAANYMQFRFNNAQIEFLEYGGGTATLATNAVFRDPSAWMHVVLAVNYGAASNSDKAKIYINGVEASYSTDNRSGLSADGAVNRAVQHSIGSLNPFSTGYYLNAFLADVFFIDGQQLTPSSFTETDATTGQLIPKAFSGSYGSQGWHLEFADNSAATATTLGKDTSGNGNNWTPTNFSVTAGAGNDSLVDTPTNGAQTDTGVGGEVRGNYCTLNPLNTYSSITLSNGNLDYSHGSSGGLTVGTIGVSTGKWYWEHIASTSYTLIGLYQSGSLSMGFVGASGVSLGFTSGGFVATSGGPTYVNSVSYGTSDVIGFALNMDAGTLTIYKNGSATSLVFSGLTGTWFPAEGANSTSSGVFNFGARSFAYTAPSGFKALCTANLPAPLVTKPNTVMDVVLYTGTGSSLTLPYASSTPTSIAFTPDLVWIKGRSGATDHALYDAVRDVQKDLVSNSTAAETTQSTGLTAFGTNTFTIGSLAKLNTSSATYAAWCWDAGTTTDPNNQAGSITSSVRANASAGFSVITATTTNTSSQTFGHGLGVAPVFHIIKLRNGTDDWYVYHSSVGATQYLKLNATTAATTSSALYANTAPTSSVITLGSGWNSTSYNIVCYAFAPVVGYSSFGSYTGNGSGSPDGPFIYTGFRPRWILFKNASTTNGWRIMDTSINPYNVVSTGLYPYLSNAEDSATNWQVDYLSNGFKVRSNSGQAEINGSGNTIIYAAFAESPFNYSRAR